MLKQLRWSWVSAGVINNTFFMFGFPGDTTNSYVQWAQWPYWLPKQLSILNCRISHQTGPTGTGNGQFAVGIDRGRQQYLQGSPHGSEITANGCNIDYSVNETLCSLFTGPQYANEPQDRIRYFDPPIAFDATTDLLWADISGAGAGDQWFFDIGFIDPGSILPWSSALNPSMPLLNADTSPLNTDNRVIVTPPSADATNALAVSFEAAQNSGMTINSAYIGPLVPGTPYQASSLTQLMFSGSPRFWIPAGRMVTSDPLPVAMSGANGYVISFNVNGAARFGSPAGWRGYYLENGQNVSGAPPATGYTAAAANVAIAQILVQ